MRKLMKTLLATFFLLVVLSVQVWAVFPTVASVTESTFSTATTAHAVLMPATVVSGDLLLALLRCDADATSITTPSGWTAKSGAVTGALYAKVADGTEGGTTVDFVTDIADEMAAQVYRINKNTWYGDVGIGVTFADATATSTTPDPPNLAPGWGTLDILWLAISHDTTSTAYTAFPANYTNTINTQETGGDASVVSVRRELNASSENPGTFTLAASRLWHARTIAIRPHERRIW